MSQANAIGAGSALTSDPRAAIARAAQATGEDFRYLLAQAKIESGLNPAAQARSSSAAGLYQFTRSTWLETLDRHGGVHGLGWAEEAIENGRVGDPGLRARIMALRFDPELSARMAAEFAGDNRAALVATLGREPDSAELYLAHFLGADGAGRFLGALAADPSQSAATLLPAAAGANRAIFYAANGSARSLGEVMGLIRGKVTAALEDPGGPVQVPDRHAAPVAPGSFASGSQSAAGIARKQPSMAETLASTFALDGGQGAPAMRAAYGKLRAFGL